MQKSNDELAGKGNVFYEGKSYILEHASKHSNFSHSYSDSGVVKQSYRHVFRLNSIDQKAQTQVQIRSNDKTVVSGEYFLKGLSITVIDESITLSVDLDKTTDKYSLVVQQKVNVIYDGEKVLNIESLYDNDKFKINWEGRFLD